MYLRKERQLFFTQCSRNRPQIKTTKQPFSLHHFLQQTAIDIRVLLEEMCIKACR